jgi:hypothetical protein
MDIISQLQEQVNQIAGLTFNTFGTLQRDAPSARLSQNYPEPPPNPTEDAASFPEQPKQMSAALVKAAKQVIISNNLAQELKLYREIQKKRLTLYDFLVILASGFCLLRVNSVF